MKRDFLTVGLLLVAGCSSAASAPVTNPVSSGRYTIFYSPQVERDTFLVDTQTGQTWQLVQGKDGSELWQAMARVN